MHSWGDRRGKRGTVGGGRMLGAGRPRGRGGLTYLGTNQADYLRIYELKSKDMAESWSALNELTRVLNLTPLDPLEAALPAHRNVDGALRFLALENALINSDGHWLRTSDYHPILGSKRPRFLSNRAAALTANSTARGRDPQVGSGFQASLPRPVRNFRGKKRTDKIGRPVCTLGSGR